jgi:hypothetical protein
MEKMAQMSFAKSLLIKVRSINEGTRKQVWSLHLDIKSFFATIDREILKNLYPSKIKDPWLINLIEIVLSHDGRIGSRIINKDFHQRLIAPEKSWYSQVKNQGVLIGSLTSQFGSNLYLNGSNY